MYVVLVFDIAGLLVCSSQYFPGIPEERFGKYCREYRGDLKVIEQIGARVEKHLRDVKGTRSVFAERTSGGYFIDVKWKREDLARHGLSIEEAQAAVLNAIGGANVTTTVEGRERYPVNVRYKPDFRTDYGSLGRLLVSALGGKRQVPLNQLAELEAVSEPAMIQSTR